MLSTKKFVGYFMTGGLAAIVDFGLFIALDGLGLVVALAATISFLIAAVVNFTTSSLFVFRTPIRLARMARFLSVASVGLAINVGVTVLIYQVLPYAPLAKIIGIGTAFLFNFVAHSKLVFGAPADRRG